MDHKIDKLISAIGDMNTAYLEEAIAFDGAKVGQQKAVRSKKLSAALVAALVILGLSVTAFAISRIPLSWRDIFSTSQTVIGDEDEEPVVSQQAAATEELQIKLEKVISDERTLYILYSVKANDGAVLDPKGQFAELDLYFPGQMMSGAYVSYFLERRDGVPENELEGVNPEFELEITKIRKFAEPELNEEFFKMAFPAGNVKTAEEFEAFVDAEISKELRRESDYLFTLQLRDFLLKKAGLTMPVEFLKRWLYVINEGKFTKEEIEKDFDAFVKLFTWNYLQKYFIKQDNLTVTPEEATAEAKALAQAQFAQYGLPTAPEDMLANYAKKILEDREQGQKIYEKLYEVKVVEDVKSKIKVTEKAVSAEDFAKLAQAL